MDSFQTQPSFIAFLAQAGLAEYDTVTRMAIEPEAENDAGIYSFALASQALN
jgi:hypothetical protein